MKVGWQTKKLGDLLQAQNGYAFSSKDYSDIGCFLIRIGNVQNGYISLSDPKFVNIPFNSPLQRFVLSDGDILMSLTGNVGRVGVMQKEYLPAVLNQRVARITINNDSPASREFLLYFLYSDLFREELMEAGHGAAQQNVSTKDIVEIQLPIPPLTEQHRIVSILDESFDGIATAKANAEQNLKSARALFESHLQSVFTQRGKGWVEKKLEDVCDKITDGTHHSPQTQFSEGGPERFPYITSKNIRNNYMDLSNVAYIERAFHNEVYARCQPSLGDVLLTKDGANTGNVTLNTLEEPFSLLSSVCLIKTNPAVLKSAFLCYYLQSSIGLGSIVGQMTGAAIKRIVLKDIKKATIPFPLLNEQDRIIVILNSLLSETQRLESIYQQKLKALDDLKKSLLHQAFSGSM